MDKRVLNEAELECLKQFIQSRGFKDNGTINEILDHLACKVEEILITEPTISLEDAIKKAHSSFGVKGFRDIAVAYEEMLRKRYNAIYWQEFAAFLRHPFHLVFLVAVGVLYFKSFEWMFIHNYRHFLDVLDLSWGAFMFILALDLIISKKRPERRKSNLIIQLAVAPNNFYWLPYLVFIFGGGGDHASHGMFIFSAVFHTILIVFAIPNFKARLKTLEKAKEDYYAINSIV